jgi:hypothetical protein
MHSGQSWVSTRVVTRVPTPVVTRVGMERPDEYPLESSFSSSYSGSYKTTPSHLSSAVPNMPSRDARVSNRNRPAATNVGRARPSRLQTSRCPAQVPSPLPSHTAATTPNPSPWRKASTAAPSSTASAAARLTRSSTRLACAGRTPSLPVIGNAAKHKPRPAKALSPGAAFLDAMTVAGYRWRSAQLLGVECPYCSDPNAYLTVHDGGGVDVNCPSGCSAQEVREAVLTRAAIAEKGLEL